MKRPQAIYEGGRIFIRLRARKYGIGFDEINTPRKALEWIAHLQKKSWFTAAIMFDLFRAMDKAYLIHTGKHFPMQHLVLNEGQLQRVDDIQYKGELPH